MFSSGWMNLFKLSMMIIATKIPIVNPPERPQELLFLGGDGGLAKVKNRMAKSHFQSEMA